MGERIELVFSLCLMSLNELSLLYTDVSIDRDGVLAVIVENASDSHVADTLAAIRRTYRSAVVAHCEVCESLNEERRKT